MTALVWDAAASASWRPVSVRVARGRSSAGPAGAGVGGGVRALRVLLARCARCAVRQGALSAEELGAQGLGLAGSQAAQAGRIALRVRRPGVEVERDEPKEALEQLGAHGHRVNVLVGH